MKVLQLCHKIPWPPLDGGSQAIHYTSIGLHDIGVDLQVLAINASRKFVEGNTLPEKYRGKIKVTKVSVDTRVKAKDAVLNIFSKDSYFISRFRSAEFEKALVEKLNSRSFDIIQLEHLYMCLYINCIRKHSDAKIIFRPQNVEYIVWERYLKNSRFSFKKLLIRLACRRLKRFEKAVISQLDGIIAITADDAAVFRKIDKKAAIVDIPLGFDFSRLSNYNLNKQYESPPCIYHLGSMDWLPNLEAIKWFLKEIYPLLRKKAPLLKIHLAGNNMPNWILEMKDEYLIASGKITETLSYQEDKMMLIVPLLSGSGIRAKIIEGMALGKTIISTTVGAQGIKYQKNVDLLIADTVEEFCNCILRCAESPELCRQVGQQARILAEKEYEYKNCATEMVKFYQNLIGVV